MVRNYNDCQVEPTGGIHTGENLNKQSKIKEKILWPTDDITNYITGWKLTLELFLVQIAVFNH